MSWNVIAFESSRRENPVEKFIGAQRSQVQAKIAHLLDLLEIHGNILGMPHAKMLSKGLYELRIRGKEELRIFYCFRENIYLLHAFKKQTRKHHPKKLRQRLAECKV